MPQPSASKPRSYAGDYMDNGKKAEAATLSFLKWAGITGIKDVRSDSDFQARDIDFAGNVVVPPWGAYTLTIEAKADAHIGESGNILFEVFRVYLDAVEPSKVLRQGWSWFSEAQCFCYWGDTKRLLYVVTADDLRLAVKKYLAEHEQANIRQIPTDKTTITFVLLIPESYVAFNVFAHNKETDSWAWVRSNPEQTTLQISGVLHKAA